MDLRAWLGIIKWLMRIELNKNTTDGVFMLYQSMNEVWYDSCEFDHTSVNSAIAILLNKCDNNYS
jgi:hypothetical protein